MATRRIKNESKDHLLTLSNKHGERDGRLVLVRGGSRAYLWAGDNRWPCVTFSGTANLRKLAHEILNEVGE